MNVFDFVPQNLGHIFNGITALVIAGPKLVSWTRRGGSWIMRRAANWFWKFREDDPPSAA
jgi:hypothetical protein